MKNESFINKDLAIGKKIFYEFKSIQAVGHDKANGSVDSVFSKNQDIKIKKAYSL
jgi:hypothetical protein